MTAEVLARPLRHVVDPAALRLDRALMNDLRSMLSSWPVLAFLGLEAASGLLFVARRGPGVVPTLLLVWLGLGLVAFLCWWAGRHRLAHPDADPVPRAGARLACALLVAVGLGLGQYGIQSTLGGGLVIGAVVAWLLIAVRRETAGQFARLLLRDPRPFVPLLLVVALPRIVLLGSAMVGRLPPALASGIGQELLYLVLLYPSMEAVTKRRDLAAVLCALVFASIHVPMNQAANGGDWAASIANAVF
jgi:hypothetical protein